MGKQIQIVAWYEHADIFENKLFKHAHNPPGSVHMCCWEVLVISFWLRHDIDFKINLIHKKCGLIFTKKSVCVCVYFYVWIGASGWMYSHAVFMYPDVCMCALSQTTADLSPALCLWSAVKLNRPITMLALCIMSANFGDFVQSTGCCDDTLRDKTQAHHKRWLIA